MSSGVTEKEAASELLRRRTARRELIHFTAYTYPNYIVEPVHELIAHHLDLVILGEITRLMIFAPPQHGKSELVSVRLPAKWLGGRPNDPVIFSSYAASLAETHSRRAREVVESQEFRALYGDLGTRDADPVSTRHDSRSVSNWNIAPPYRGGMLATGVGGPVTGRGGPLGIVDDPFENWEQAQSLTYRNKIWEWYRTTFRSRIWEGGAIVIINTRWNEDDLCGRILKEQADKWVVLRLPALAETQEERDANDAFLGLATGQPEPLGRAPGEALAPKRFSVMALDEIKRDVGSQAWAALYQGVPRAPEGNRFKRHWFTGVDGEKIVAAAPRDAKYTRYWDKAGTEGGGGAATAGVLLAQSEKLTYVVDSVRGWWSAGERERVIKQTAERDEELYGRHNVEIYIEQEGGSGGKESAEATITNLRGFRIKKDSPTGDKDTRLEPFAVQAEAGNVRMVRGHWNHDYVEEMVSVPNGARRDQADATAGAFNMMNKKKTMTKRVPHSGLYKSRNRR